ncbi:hypothetical protein O3800_03575 [Gemella sanguinis]|uniref:hypothetical protein n=1 Tax=Gemella sanguinis TaxID=84135 RepID=UPI00352DF4C4
MLNKKIRKMLLSLLIVTAIVVGMYYILVPPKVLTRENNKGNEVQQLDRLMNTTRYAEQIRKAGYEVDDYDLKIMDRIPKLETNGKVKVIILSPDGDGKLYTYLDDRSKFIIFDKNMNIVSSVIDQDKEKPSRKLTEEEKPKYKKEVKEEINKLLADVYKAGRE